MHAACILHMHMNEINCWPLFLTFSHLCIRVVVDMVRFTFCVHQNIFHVIRLIPHLIYFSFEIGFSIFSSRWNWKQKQIGIKWKESRLSNVFDWLGWSIYVYQILFGICTMHSYPPHPHSTSTANRQIMFNNEHLKCMRFPTLSVRCRLLALLKQQQELCNRNNWVFLRFTVSILEYRPD